MGHQVQVSLGGVGDVGLLESLFGIEPVAAGRQLAPFGHAVQGDVSPPAGMSVGDARAADADGVEEFDAGPIYSGMRQAITEIDILPRLRA